MAGWGARLILAMGFCGLGCAFDTQGSGQAVTDGGSASSGAVSPTVTDSDSSASSGSATTTGSDSASGTTANSTAGTTSAGPTTDPTDTTNPTDTTGGSTDASGGSSSSAGDDTGSASGSVNCQTSPLVAEVQLVAEATNVTAPMTVVAAWGGLPTDPDAAYSTTGEQGTITFAVDLPCAGTYYVWGLTWDRFFGVGSCGGTSNPDNFYVQVDGGEDVHWSYGCEGCNNPNAVWDWLPAHRYIGSGCQTELLQYDLAAGTHTIRFRNREGSMFDNDQAPNVAAIAGVAIANASDYDPATEYAP